MKATSIMKGKARYLSREFPTVFSLFRLFLSHFSPLIPHLYRPPLYSYMQTLIYVSSAGLACNLANATRPAIYFHFIRGCFLFSLFFFSVFFFSILYNAKIRRGDKRMMGVTENYQPVCKRSHRRRVKRVLYL